jgi:hypothetical protein
MYVCICRGLLSRVVSPYESRKSLSLRVTVSTMRLQPFDDHVFACLRVCSTPLRQMNASTVLTAGLSIDNYHSKSKTEQTIRGGRRRQQLKEGTKCYLYIYI